MTKIVQVLCMAGCLFFGVDASNEFACKCNNKTSQAPACGPCGSESGKMEQTETGISCFCENDLKFSHTECEAVCAKDGGWTGEFESQ